MKAFDDFPSPNLQNNHHAHQVLKNTQKLKYWEDESMQHFLVFVISVPLMRGDAN